MLSSLLQPIDAVSLNSPLPKQTYIHCKNNVENKTIFENKF